LIQANSLLSGKDNVIEQERSKSLQQTKLANEFAEKLKDA